MTSIKRAVIINALGKYSSVIFQLIFTAILSRILSPSEFGMVAFINVFVAFFELFADLGIGTAIIQRKDLNKCIYKEIYGFMCLSGLLLSGMFVVLSKVISIICGDKTYVYIGILFSISIIITSMNVVPNALVMKDKLFVQASIRTVISCIISYSVAIMLALQGWSVYALVIRYIIMIVFQWVWNSVIIRLLPTFHNVFSSIDSIKEYSLFQLGASMLNYIQRNIDNILVKKFFGDAALGYYDKSYTLMRYPISYLANVITPVLHPILAEYQEDLKKIYVQYIKVLKGLSIIGIWIASIFLSSSKEIILLMYGQQWTDAIEPLRIMSYCVWPQMLTGTVGCIMQSIGNTKTLFKICATSIGVSLIGIILGIMTGELQGLSYCIVAVYWIHLYIYFRMVMKLGFKYKFKAMVIEFLPDIISFLLMAVIAKCVERYILLDGLICSFITKLFILTVVYALLLVSLNKNNPYVVNIRHRLNKMQN